VLIRSILVHVCLIDRVVAHLKYSTNTLLPKPDGPKTTKTAANEYVEVEMTSLDHRHKQGKHYHNTAEVLAKTTV
jgi:hypothetical protein